MTEDNYNLRESSSISPVSSKGKIIDKQSIIRSNILKWEERDKKYKFLYKEEEDYINNTIGEFTPPKIIKDILNYYMKSLDKEAYKQYELTLKNQSEVLEKIIDNITILMSNSESKIDKNSFLCRIESYITKLS